MVIWNNSLIKVAKKLIFLNEAWEHGLIFAGQMFTCNGQIKPYNEIVTEFGSVLTWFEYYQIVAAIPVNWKCLLVEGAREPPSLPCFLAVQNCHKISNIVYTKLINVKTKILKKKEMWERRLATCIEDLEYMSLFNNIVKVTIVSKFRDFQYRLLHNALVTNKNLYLWKIIDSD